MMGTESKAPNGHEPLSLPVIGTYQGTSTGKLRQDPMLTFLSGTSTDGTDIVHVY